MILKNESIVKVLLANDRVNPNFQNEIHETPLI